MTKLRKIGKTVGISFGILFGLFFLLLLSIYLPPIQRWLIGQVATSVKETMGIDVRIGVVRLTPFLDLQLDRLVALDEEGDTLLHSKTIALDVAFMPLWEGRANIRQFDLQHVRINTKSFIPDVAVSGKVGSLRVQIPSIDWSEEQACINAVTLADAHLSVVLADTAQKDTTTTSNNWKIDLQQARIRNSQLNLSLPGDSVHVRTTLKDALLTDTRLNLAKAHYAFRQLRLQGAGVMMNTAPVDLPQQALFDLSGLSVIIDTLSLDSASRLHCYVRQVAFTERQRDLRLTHLSGSVYADTTQMRLPHLRLSTPHSALTATADIDFRALAPDGEGNLHLRLNGHLGFADVFKGIQDVFPPGELALWEQQLRQNLPVACLPFQAFIEGNMKQLAVRQAQIELPKVATFTARGTVHHATLPLRSGNLSFAFKGDHLRPLESFLPADIRTSYGLPEHLSVDGNVQFRAASYACRFGVSTPDGRIDGKASTNLDSEAYALQASIHHFPLTRFIKEQPLTPLTGTMSLQGKGFSPLAASSSLQAQLSVETLHYKQHPLDGLQVEGTLRGGQTQVTLSADNPLIRAKGTLVGGLTPSYTATLDLDIEHFDAAHLTPNPDTLQIALHFNGQFTADPQFRHLTAQGEIDQARVITAERGYFLHNTHFAAHSSPDSTTTFVRSGDLQLDLSLLGSLDQLKYRGQHLTNLVLRQIQDCNIDQEALRQALPTASLHLSVGQDNPLTTLLRQTNYRLQNLDLALRSNVTDGLNGQLRAAKLQTGGLVIDTIFAQLVHNTEGIRFNGTIHNQKRTNPNPFTATIESYLFEQGVGGLLTFKDGQQNTGLQLGAKMHLQHDGYRFSLYPQTAIVAYRRFAVNPDNFVFWGNDRTLRAHLNLLADDGTGLQLYSAGVDTTKNDITVSLKDVNLKELSQSLPLLPAMSGMLNADFHLIDDHKTISAMGTIDTRKFAYEGAHIGELGTELVYMPKSEDEHVVVASILFEGQEIGDFRGSYFTRGTGSISGTAFLKSLPLRLANGFMENTDFAMRGTAEGEIQIEGNPSEPQINGTIDLNEAHLYSNVYGVDFALDERPLVFANSKLEFDRYQLTSTNNNALVINGNVDLSQPSNMRLHLDMNAKNFALINTKRKGESLVYGKVFTDFAATVRGSLSDMKVKGNLDILNTTDVTYLLMNSPLSVNDELSGIVTFVDFSDTITVVQEPQKTASAMDIALGVNILPGANFHCFLSHNGDSYVNVMGEGKLSVRMTQQGDMLVNGRLTLSEGKMNYELPVVPLRTFTLEPGSYVEFKGDVTNPTLSLKATDRIKTVITENERQRAVVFDAGINISRSLEDMGLEFIIDAPEDLSLQNRLTAMSTEDRGKAAVALLATGMFISDDHLSSGGLKASNALNAFLQSEIRNIAGKALSTIDISVGMDNGVSASGAKTTDYSFQFSKRFWNNRMRIIIGGKVSTGAEATNNSEAFIDNIAVEYRLDSSGGRYVRLFYDRDSHDPFEGTLMNTGIGLVLRRKSDRLGDLFLFRRKKSATSSTNPSTH